MISFEEAQAAVSAEVSSGTASEEIDLLSAQDRVLAEDIVALFDVPPKDCSAMDGFAVMADDIMQAREELPITLRLVGEIAAGQTAPAKLWEGEAVQIMTGAPVPDGTEVVVPIENTIVHTDRVNILRQLPGGKNIRLRGEDVKKGEVVLKKGAWLRSTEIALLACLGYNKVNVKCRPKVAVLATGDELLEPGQPRQEGKIYSSNHYALAAQVRHAGGEPVLLGIANDTRAGLKKLLARGLEYPILITSGGVSVGKYDLVKDVLEELGLETKFWKVAIKPGKPTLFGTYNKRLVFGLPGYPVATMLCFEHFIRPSIAQIMGADYSPVQFEALLEEDLRCKPGRKKFLRARLRVKEGRHYVSSLKTQGSAVLSALSQADCLIIAPLETAFLAAGDKVTVQLLDN